MIGQGAPQGQGWQLQRATLAVGTILRGKETGDRWRIHRVSESAEGIVTYGVTFVGKEYHVNVIYAYEIPACFDIEQAEVPA